MQFVCKACHACARQEDQKADPPSDIYIYIYSSNLEVLSEDELIIVHAYKLLVVDLKQRNIAGWCSTQGKQKVLCPVFSCGLVFLFFVFILASARNMMNGHESKNWC